MGSDTTDDEKRAKRCVRKIGVGMGFRLRWKSKAGENQFLDWLLE